MRILNKIIILLLLIPASSNVEGQNNMPGCRDSSIHIRYSGLQDHFIAYKQIFSIDGGRIIIGKIEGIIPGGNALVIKISNTHNVLWSRKISAASPYNKLAIHSVEESGNGNIAIAGTVQENNGNNHFYWAILSPAGTIIREVITAFAGATGSGKGSHTICRLSTDSLLFLFAVDVFAGGGQGLCMISTDNAGNTGYSSVAAISTDYSIAFFNARISGNKLNLYGSGYSGSGCSNLNWSGTFTSLQIDMTTRQVIYHKSYCVPYTAYSSDYLPPDNSNPINDLPLRVFSLANGKTAMVRPYKGYSTTTANTPLPMFISWFDSSFNLLHSEFLRSDRLFKTPTIQDMYIDSNSLIHINFTDHKNQRVYYAVADSNRNLLLQKKMVIQVLDSSGSDNRLQVLQPGMLTGFTTQNFSNGQSSIDYVQVRAEDITASCYGTDTSFLSFISAPVTPVVTGNPVIVSSASVIETPINFIVSDYTLERTDICITKKICDTIKLNGPGTVCNVIDPVSITAHKNLFCSEKINFRFDTAAVISWSQPNDTTLLLKFPGNWKGKIYADISSCPSLKDSLALIVSAPFSNFNIGADTTFCPGHTYVLKVPEGFNTYRWQNNSDQITYTATEPGKYYVTVSDFCTREYSDTITIGETDFSLSAGKDTTICQSDRITLKATPGFLNYSWQPVYNINNPSGMSVAIFPDITTMYIVTAEKFSGCILSDSINVFVENCPRKFYVPNAFSPRINGKNDAFKPIVSGVLIKYEFMIFNRWGQQVFRSTNRYEGWNGRLNNKNQEGNVFAWVCKYQFANQPVQVQKGAVIVIP